MVSAANPFGGTDDDDGTPTVMVIPGGIQQIGRYTSLLPPD
jgi:hypothetical protein